MKGRTKKLLLVVFLAWFLPGIGFKKPTDRVHVTPQFKAGKK